MPTDATAPVIAALQDYGLVALFVVFVLEGAMLLYVAPSESLVPAAVLSPLASTPAEYALVIGIAVAGATTGQLALFAAAKRGGRTALEGRRWLRIGTDRVECFEGWFARWGPLVIPASNAMLFTRGMLTIPAGLAGMDARRFALLSAAGTAVFETALAALTLGALEIVP